MKNVKVVKEYVTIEIFRYKYLSAYTIVKGQFANLDLFILVF
jgi:hypothetical protein